MEEMKIEKPLKKPKGWGTRHTLMVLGFIGFGASYALRFNLSLAIVAMVKHNQNVNLKYTNNTDNLISTLPPDACPELSPANLSKSESEAVAEEGEFLWDEAEQGIILGSFFYGYFLTQLPGGILSSRYGGKHPLGIGLLVTAIFALLLPVAARTHKYALIFVRVVQGLGEGLTTPAMHNILGKWAIPEERSIMGSVIYAGCQFGTAMTMIISGYLIHLNVFNDGWASVFYITGTFTIIWYVFWCLCVYDSPAVHPRISPEELCYIQRSIGSQPSQGKAKTPWKAILTSLPFWAIVIGHTGHAYGLYTLLTELPTYLKTILRFDIKQNSWLSAVPYLLMWAISIGCTQLIDCLISRKLVRTITARKVCQTISQIGPAIFLLLASISGCDRALTVVLLTLAVGINGVVYGGYVVNHVDLSSNHSGILMGITNTFANFTGFIAPAVAGALIKNNATLGRWQIVFGISAAIYSLGAIFFMSFAQASEQPWNRPETTDESRENGSEKSPQK